MEEKYEGKIYTRQDIVCDRLNKLLSYEDHSDVAFVVGAEEQKYFRAHKLILSTASDVFKEMFYGSLPADDSPVEIPDLRPDGFSAMLRYVYESKVQFSSVFNAINTLTAANKYLLKNLRNICFSYIEENVTPQCACAVYETARLFEDIKLERTVSSMLICHKYDVIEDDSFLSAEQSTVEFILRYPMMVGLITDSELFDAVLRWGKVNMTKSETASNGNEANLRNVVQPLLPFIHFLSMSAEEFVGGPVKSEIFTAEEALSLLLNILQPGIRPLPLWASPNRKSKNEEYERRDSMTFCSYQKHTKFSPVKSLQYKFTAERTMLLVGIHFFITECLRNRSFKVQLFNLTRDFCFFHCDESAVNCVERCRIMLEKPPLLYPGETCKITISFETVVHIAKCEKSNLRAETGYGIHEIRFYNLDPLPE